MAPWLMIDQVDAVTASTRACHDEKLYAQMLRTAMATYGNWGNEWREKARHDPQALGPALLHSLHKVQGSAGVLGATHVHAAAQEAEEALKQGADDLQHWIDHVAGPMDRLFCAIRRWDEQLVAEDSPSVPHENTSDQDPEHTVELLIRLMEAGDLGAIDLARQARPLLKQQLSPSEMADKLVEQIETIAFDQALQTLKRHQASRRSMPAEQTPAGKPFPNK